MKKKIDKIPPLYHEGKLVYAYKSCHYDDDYIVVITNINRLLYVEKTIAESPQEAMGKVLNAYILPKPPEEK